jgi:hypothetical protein
MSHVSVEEDSIGLENMEAQFLEVTDVTVYHNIQRKSLILAYEYQKYI